MSPDDGSFYIAGEKSPSVEVGEELTIGLTPFSEMQERLAEVERRMSIPRDPIRYPGTTPALSIEGVEKSPGEVRGTPPNPLEFIQGLINNLPPLKLPPLPPLPVFPTATSPTKGAEKVVSESKTESAEEVSDKIVPLVYE